jgi:hypothetical protein
MKELYKRIYELFAANQQLFIDAGLQPVATIDRWRNQTTNPERFDIYPLPALFVGYRTQWDKPGRNYRATHSIDVHVVLDEPWHTGNIYTGYEDALEKLMYYELVDQLLDGLVITQNFAPLQKEADVPVDTGVICYTILSYTTTIEKAPADKQYIIVNDVTVNITGKSLVKSL